jgi:hypothetical protein
VSAAAAWPAAFLGLALCLCDVQIPPDLAIASAPELRVLGASGATARTATEVLTPLGVFASGSGEGGSEIVAVDPASDQMFITNGTANAVDIVNTADPNSPVKVTSVDASSWAAAFRVWRWVTASSLLQSRLR